MKRKPYVWMMVLLMALSLSQTAKANMAAPADPDVGSAITFQKNEEISVLSEVLDITVHGSKADMVVTYTMKNTTQEQVVTPSMFLSPNVEQGNVEVTVDGEAAPFTVDRYAMNYSTQIQTADWKYVVLSTGDVADVQERTVDAISFELTFEPGEESQVVVSYTYALGGYPDYDFDAKRGDLKYYLQPAALWKDFSNLTINLNLDEDMPVLKYSNLPFEEVAPRTYQYTSTTLPEENLDLTIDESWWQNIFSTLRSPYFQIAWVLAPVALVVLVCVVLIRQRKSRA